MLVNIRILYIPIYLFLIFFIFIFKSNIKNTNKLNLIFVVILLVTVFGYFLNTPIAEYYKFLTSFQNDNFVNYFGDNRLVLILLSIASTIGWTIILFIGIAVIALFFRGAMTDSRKLLVDFFISIFLAYYCALQLAIPLRGDMTELSQRPFLVFNILISITIICQLYFSLGTVFINTLLIMIIGVNVVNYRPYGFPVDHPWHILTFRIPIEKDVVDIAHQFFNEKIGARFVFVPIQQDYFGSYPEAVITSMTLSRAYISRMGLNKQNYGDNDINLNAKEAYIRNILNCNYYNYINNEIYFISKNDIACLKKEATFGIYKIFK